MAAWRRAAEWDCSDCAGEPGLREYRGCNGLRDDEPGFTFGSADRPVEIRMCASRELMEAQDITGLMRAGSLADWRLSLTEQDTLPRRYLDAWALASNEVGESSAARAKEDSNSG